MRISEKEKTPYPLWGAQWSEEGTAPL